MKKAVLFFFVAVACLLYATILCGCSDESNDYGVSAVCLQGTEAEWASLSPHVQGMVEPIDVIGWEFGPLYPGQLLTYELRNGDDLDYRLSPVDPNGYCSNGCEADEICIAVVTNQNAPYQLLGYSGYLEGVEIDPTYPLCERVYVAARYEPIDSLQAYSIIYVRAGASVSETIGNNFGELIIESHVYPTEMHPLGQIHYLDGVAPTGTGYDISQAFTEMQDDISRDMSRQAKHRGYTLKQRCEEYKDNSVNAKYVSRGVTYFFDIPKNWNSGLDVLKALFYAGLMYDYIVVETIDYDPNDMTYGLAYLNLNIFLITNDAPNKPRTILHEIGHLVGCSHWDEGDCAWNIMCTTPIAGGPNQPLAMDIHGSHEDQQQKFENGIGRW